MPLPTALPLKPLNTIVITVNWLLNITFCRRFFTVLLLFLSRLCEEYREISAENRVLPPAPNFSDIKRANGTATAGMTVPFSVVYKVFAVKQVALKPRRRSKKSSYL